MKTSYTKSIIEHNCTDVSSTIPYLYPHRVVMYIFLLCSLLIVSCGSNDFQSSVVNPDEPITLEQPTQSDIQTVVSDESGSLVPPAMGILVDTSNMQVIDVFPDTPAFGGGVKVGDILVSWEDMPFATQGKKIKDRIFAEKPSKDKKFKLIVLRDGKEILLKFDLVNLVDIVATPGPTPTVPPSDGSVDFY
ncbi:MAG: hypothetical protein R3A44_36760 [Caldilineaceae bacterium]